MNRNVEALARRGTQYVPCDAVAGHGKHLAMVLDGRIAIVMGGLPLTGPKFPQHPIWFRPGDLEAHHITPSFSQGNPLWLRPSPDGTRLLMDGNREKKSTSSSTNQPRLVLLQPLPTRRAAHGIGGDGRRHAEAPFEELRANQFPLASGQEGRIGQAMTKSTVHSEERAVWRVAGEIAEVLSSSVSSAALGQEIRSALDRLVRCDLGATLCASPGQDWSINGQKGDNETIRRNHWRYGLELKPAELQQLSMRFTQDLDIIPQARRERLSVNREFLAPNRQLGYVARYWFMDGLVWGIGMSRSSRFSEREVARLNAIFPQVRAALRAGTWLVDEDSGFLRRGPSGACSLSRAEERAALLVLRGLTNKEIGGLLGVSPNTVRNTLARVFEKLGVSRRSEIGFVLRGGIVEGNTRRDASRDAHQRQLTAAQVIKDAPVDGVGGDFDPPRLHTGVF